MMIYKGYSRTRTGIKLNAPSEETQDLHNWGKGFVYVWISRVTIIAQPFTDKLALYTMASDKKLGFFDDILCHLALIPSGY